MGEVTNYFVACPKCGGNVFDEKYAKDDVYVCRSRNGYGEKCDCVIAYCKNCKKFYVGNGFGLHGDVYECKECGTINWPYTEYKREVARVQEEFERVMRSSEDFLDFLNRK